LNHFCIRRGRALVPVSRLFLLCASKFVPTKGDVGAILMVALFPADIMDGLRSALMAGDLQRSDALIIHDLIPRNRRSRGGFPPLLSSRLRFRSLGGGHSRHRVDLLVDPRERMQEIDGLPKLGRYSVGDIDHLDESCTRGIEPLELKPIVKVAQGVEIAEGRRRGRTQGLGEKRFSSEGVEEEGGLCSHLGYRVGFGTIDIPQQVKLAKREPIRKRGDPGVIKLGRDAGLLIDPNVRIVDVVRIRRWVHAHHMPKDINGDFPDRNPEAWNAEIDATCRINGGTLSVGGDRDQAVERADRTSNTTPDGRRSVQRLGRAVPGQPVDRKAHRTDCLDEFAGRRIEQHKRAILGAGIGRQTVMAVAGRAHETGLLSGRHESGGCRCGSCRCSGRR